MFGGVAAKVNGHIFAGLFGRSTMLWLPEADRAEALALEGAEPFDPMGNGRVRSDKVMPPVSMMDEPDELRAWVTHLYVTKGLPDFNRILLDVWIAEAHIVGGVLFLVGARKANPLPWILSGALMVWTYALPFLPILIHRAKPIFWVMPTLYSVVCAVVVRMVAQQAASAATV